MLITDVTLQKKNSQRVNLYLDGEFAFALSLNVAADEKLKKGKEISPAELLELKERATAADAKKKAYDYLGRRAHSKAELLQKLRRSEKTRDGAKAALAELESFGYLDDSQYAEMMAKHLSAKGYGEKKIRYELKAKGVEDEIVEQIVADIPENTYEKIQKILEKKYPQGISNEKEKRRAVNLLVRYGYTLQEIFKVLGGEFE